MGGPLGIYVDTQLDCLRHLGGILYYRHLCCGCPRMSQRTLQRGLLTLFLDPEQKTMVCTVAKRVCMFMRAFVHSC